MGIITRIKRFWRDEDSFARQIGFPFIFLILICVTIFWLGIAWVEMHR